MVGFAVWLEEHGAELVTAGAALVLLVLFLALLASVATIEQVSGNVILFKAESPGNTSLRVVAGSAEAEATIRVVRADE